MFSTYRSVLPDSASTEGGRLSIGGVDLRELADTYGTPLYVYDEAHVERVAREYVDGFAAWPEDVQVVYACKAACFTGLLELTRSLGLGADVASGGELAIALAAGVPATQIVVHGNNKSRSELAQAVEAGVGLVVLDSDHEADLLEAVAREQGTTQAVLVRVTPGITPETHRYITTGHTGSKFGLDPDPALELLQRAHASDALEAQGVHVHLGSQLLDLAPWHEVVEWLAAYAVRLDAAGVRCSTVDLGGGLGIAYKEDQQPPSVEQLASDVVTGLRAAWEQTGLPLPRLVLEPGRSLVGAAGITLYEVGTVKQAGDFNYVNVDGGMSDNIRPMLYQAQYRALLPERAESSPTGTHWIVGKHCESGDVLIEDAPLPDPAPGDLLAVLATGAYAQSMGSNYNALPRPAVVFVRDGAHRLVVRRETTEDLLARDVARAGAGA